MAQDESKPKINRNKERKKSKEKKLHILFCWIGSPQFTMLYCLLFFLTNTVKENLEIFSSLNPSTCLFISSFQTILPLAFLYTINVYRYINLLYSFFLLCCWCIFFWFCCVRNFYWRWVDFLRVNKIKRMKKKTMLRAKKLKCVCVCGCVCLLCNIVSCKYQTS